MGRHLTGLMGYPQAKLTDLYSTGKYGSAGRTAFHRKNADKRPPNLGFIRKTWRPPPPPPQGKTAAFQRRGTASFAPRSCRQGRPA